MATYRMQDAVITVGTAVGKLLSGEVRITNSPVETTGGGDTWRERKPGYSDWSMRGSFRFQGSLPATGAQATCSLQVNDSASVQAGLGQGAGVVDDAGITGEHEGAVDMDISIVGNGALTITEGT